jgi:hypothetical protein
MWQYFTVLMSLAMYVFQVQNRQYYTNMYQHMLDCANQFTPRAAPAHQ